MGSLIVEEAGRDPGAFRLVGGVESAGHPQAGKSHPAHPALPVESDLGALLKKGADLVIEFTTPEATLAHAETAAKGRVPMVIGTTGLSPEQVKRLKALSRQVPIFWSPNMSLGIVIARRAIGAVSRLLFQFGLGERARARISETHHTQKKDSPSGTAKALRDELLKETGWLIRDEEIEARREGEVIGIHSVTFDCPAEKITLTHEATDRRVFAQGVLVIARNFRRIWTKPGGYGMDDFVTALQK